MATFEIILNYGVFFPSISITVSSVKIPRTLFKFYYLAKPKSAREVLFTLKSKTLSKKLKINIAPGYKNVPLYFSLIIFSISSSLASNLPYFSYAASISRFKCARSMF